MHHERRQGLSERTSATGASGYPARQSVGGKPDTNPKGEKAETVPLPQLGKHGYRRKEQGRGRIQFLKDPRLDCLVLVAGGTPALHPRRKEQAQRPLQLDILYPRKAQEVIEREKREAETHWGEDELKAEAEEQKA